MKEKILELVLKTLLDLILTLIKKGEDQEKEMKEMGDRYKADIALAEKARKAYPSLSDEAIMKELC